LNHSHPAYSLVTIITALCGSLSLSLNVISEYISLEDS